MNPQLFNSAAKGAVRYYTSLWLSPIYPYREGVEKVLGSLTVSPEELAYGKTKIFIRSPKTVSQEVHCLWWGWNLEPLRKRLAGEAAPGAGLDGA